MNVLDTNVIPELRQGKPHQAPAVRAWDASQASGQFFLSAGTGVKLIDPFAS